MTEKPTKREPEVLEPGGRNHQVTEKMTSEDLAAAYADATRFRAHELGYNIDGALNTWMKDARDVLAERGHLEMIRECLPVYFDPSRKTAVFGPGGKLSNQQAIEKAGAPRALKPAG